jgi:hypothetical protein
MRRGDESGETDADFVVMQGTGRDHVRSSPDLVIGHRSTMKDQFGKSGEIRSKEGSTKLF